MISVCFWLSVRIYSSLLLEVPVDSLERRKRTGFSQMLCVPFHLQLGNSSIAARLAGVANPLYQGCPAQRDKAEPPLVLQQRAWKWQQFLLRSPWAITFGVNSLTFRSRVGGARHENAWGKEAHLHHISDHQDMLPGDCLWVLGYRVMICNIPKYSIKKDPKLRQCPAAPTLMVETDFPHLLTSHPNPHLFNKQ